jgi:RNA-directed DNA polymerase
MATSTLRTTTTVLTECQSVVSKNQSSDCDPLLMDIFFAYYCARQNKRSSSSQVRFERNLAENLIDLYREISSGRYKIGRSMCFVIKAPVLREVFAASFRDRIVHHLLFNWLSPIFERTFIYDSYSCRKGKGTGLGVARLMHHVRSCSDNFTKPCFILKLDIEGYFMNINRNKLYEMTCSRIVSYAQDHPCPFDLNLALRLLSLVIFNDPTRGCYRKGSLSDWDKIPKGKSLFYASEGCGLPIGNLTSQLFSNVYLSVFDDYVKRELKVRHYGRYVDDFYLVSESKDFLLSCIPKIRSFLYRKLELRLHPRKITLAPAGKGVRFLGKMFKRGSAYIHPEVWRRSYARLLDVVTFEDDPYSILRCCKSAVCVFRNST